MEKEINKIKKEYRSIAPSVFLEKKGVVDLWSRVDYEEKPKYIFYSRSLAILLIVLVGIAGFIGVTYAAVPGSVLYEVKKITRDVARHVPIVNSVIPQDSVPSLVPTRILPTTTPALKEENLHEESKKIEADEPSRNEVQKEKEESEVKGETTQESNHPEDNEASKKGSSQDEKNSDHKDENKKEKESESENHKED